MPDLPDSFRIRPARPDDADALSDIFVHSFPAKFRFAFGLGQEETSFLLGELYRHGLMPLAETRVAEIAGRVVGFAILHTEPDRLSPSRAFWRVLYRNLGLLRGLRALVGSTTLGLIFASRIPKGNIAYLDALAVHEAERRRGIGSRLLEHCFMLARAAGCSEIALHVVNTNPDARRLYERFGFTVRGEQRFLPRLASRFARFRFAYLMVKSLVSGR